MQVGIKNRYHSFWSQFVPLKGCFIFSSLMPVLYCRYNDFSVADIVKMQIQLS